MDKGITELAITPFTASGCAHAAVPGSKSITNRALILAAMRNGDTLLNGALFSEDTRIMIDCLVRLGFAVAYNEEAAWIKIKGAGGKIPKTDAELYVGNAGTTARFLTAFLALQKNGSYKIDGSEAMRKRPMSGLIDALESLGARFEFREQARHFPFVMRTQGIGVPGVSVDASASSQILSALLQIAPVIAQETRSPFTVSLAGETVSHPFVQMTLSMIRQFGRTVPANGSPYVFDGSMEGASDALFTYPVEPDATAASYFLMLPFVVGGAIRVDGLVLDGLQGDADFAGVMNQLGLLDTTKDGDGVVSRAGISREGASVNFNAISDTFLTLAAVTPLLDSATCISGIAHTRKQETDRIAAMAAELAKLVGDGNVTQTEDSLTVKPIGIEALRKRVFALPGASVRIATYKDHRVAMSFGILGCFDLFGNGKPWIVIEDPLCCSKTFPHFFDELDAVRNRLKKSL